MHRMLLVVLLTVVVSCRAQSPAAVAPVRLFGPVIGNEVIAGRADDDSDAQPVMLLVAETALVTLDLDHRTASRQRLDVADDGGCWGLGRLQDGSLWTVCDWRKLRQIEPSGRTVREIELAGAQVALFGDGDRLLFQRAEFVAPTQALVAGTPGSPRRDPWGTLQTRPYNLARTAVAALNLVTCGNTRAAERACWFPDDPAVAMIDRTGRTRRVELTGIPRVAPEVLLTSDNPARPVRDAFVDRAGSIWVISSGTSVPGAADLPGGWMLAHFGPTGAPLDSLALSEPARLILRADTHRVVLLLGSGYVGEVRL